MIACDSAQKNRTAGSTKQETSTPVGGETQTTSTAAAPAEALSLAATMVAEFGVNMEAELGVGLVEGATTNISADQLQQILAAVTAKLKELGLDTAEDPGLILPEISAAATIKVGELTLDASIKSNTVGQITRAGAKLIKGRLDKLLATGAADGLTALQTVFKKHMDGIIAALAGSGFAAIDKPKTLGLIATNIATGLSACELPLDKTKEVITTLGSGVIQKLGSLTGIDKENIETAIQSITSGALSGLINAGGKDLDLSKLQDIAPGIISALSGAVGKLNIEGATTPADATRMMAAVTRGLNDFIQTSVANGGDLSQLAALAPILAQWQTIVNQANTKLVHE